MSSRIRFFLLSSFVALLSTGFLFLGNAQTAPSDFHEPSVRTVQPPADLPPGLGHLIAQSRAADLPDAYHLIRQAEVYQAANPAHDLQVAFTATGLEAQGDGWTWNWALTGWGRAGQVEPVPSAVRRSDDTRIEYQRGPALTEWYVNSDLGVEQGFTLDQAPSRLGESGTQPLALEFSTSGSVRVQTQTDVALALINVDNGGLVARYSHLYAYDADSKPLSAHFAISAQADRVQILVDDQHAHYPITIDPWLQKYRLTATDTRGQDRLGYSVAVDGNVAVVGAPYESDHGTGTGAAFVYVSSGSWITATETAQLVASDGTAGDQLGYSVAISGTTIVVGAPYANISGHDKQGAAYVFVRPVSGWSGTLTQTAKLTASDGAASDWFGWSVAIRGSTVAVGAPQTSAYQEHGGAVYVFLKPGGGWANATQNVRLNPSWCCINQSLGNAVAISEDEQTIAGAASNLATCSSSNGAIFVYVKGTGWGTGTKDPNATLTASDCSSQPQAQLGQAVAMSGDVIVATSTSADGYKGAAYVFVKPGGGWSGTLTQTARLTASDSASNDWFGSSVSISGNTVVVGAKQKRQAYIYVRGASWANATETVRLSTSETGFDYFGSSVAISGDAVLVGAYYYNTYQGTAYAYVKPVGGWATTAIPNAKMGVTTGGRGDGFGASVAISNDTVVVGADNSSKGAAYVFTRPGGAWTDRTQAAKLVASDGADGDHLGYAVAISQDMIAVTAYRAHVGGQDDKGAVYLFIKPAGGWTGTLTESAKLIASDVVTGDQFGTAVAISADTVVVGAGYAKVGGNSYQGAAYVFVKPGGGWSGTLTQTAKLIAGDGTADSYLGDSVSISGDTVAVGADGADSWRGAAYVFVKPGGGWSGTLTQIAKLTSSDNTGDGLGWSTSISGDVIVAGATGATGASAYSGAAYVYVKPSSGWTTAAQTAKLTASDGASSDLFGWSVSISGDIIGVGAYQAPYANSTSGPGVAYIFVKPVTGWITGTQAARLTGQDTTSGNSLGMAVAIDGATLVAGSPGYASSQGEAYVFPASLNLAKSVTPPNPLAGQAVTYTLAFSNSYAFTATQVVLTDVLPAHVLVGNVASSGAAITNTGHVPAYVWQVQNLGRNQGGVITITGVTYDVWHSETLTDVATLAAANADSVSASTSVTVRGSIQSHINAASNGQTLSIPPGVYTESLTLAKPVSLTSATEAGVVIHALSNNRVLTITGASVNSSVVISGLVFVGGNVTGNGGGVLIQGSARPVLRNVVIQNNVAFGNGGGLFADVGSPLTLLGASVLSNTATNGGGLYGNDSLALTNTQILGNMASGDGGGACANSAITLEQGLFQNNTSSGGGGGIYAAAALESHNTRFMNNAAGTGGAIHHANGGAVDLAQGRMVNTLFARNAAVTHGDVLYLEPSAHAQKDVILHSTIISPTIGVNEAIYVGNDPTVGVTDTIVASYTTGINNSSGTVSQDYNLFFANTLTGTGTIAHGVHSLTNLDPLFVNPESDDYHLNRGSPATAAGVDAGVDMDLEGRVRSVIPTIGAYEATSYILTLNTTGTGSGSVTKEPSSAVYAEGAVVTLTAMANTGSTFAGWSGSISSATSPVTLTMDGNKIVTATFTLNTYTLTVNKVGTGSGSVSTNPSGTLFGYNTVVTLTATPDTGSSFSGWSSNCTLVGLNCVVTMTANTTVTATFILRPAGTFALAVSKAGNGMGTVTSIPAGIACGTGCTANFTAGVIVTLTAVPVAGSSFTGWSGTVMTTTNPLVLTMDTAKAVTATFITHRVYLPEVFKP